MNNLSNEDFSNLSRSAEELIVKYHSLRTEMTGVIDAFIQADLDTPIAPTSLDEIQKYIYTLIKYSRASEATHRDAGKSHTRLTNKSNKILLLEERRASKKFSKMFGKSMFTGADILNGSLNISDGLTLIHRGELISEIGVSFELSLGNVKSCIEEDLIQAKVGEEPHPISRNDRYKAGGTLVKEITDCLNSSKTYVNSKDLINDGIFVKHWAANNGKPVIEIMLNALIKRCMIRAKIFKIASLTRQQAKLIDKAHLIIMKKGAVDYTIVDPSSIRVFSAQGNKNVVNEVAVVNKGVQVAKFEKVKSTIDLSLLVGLSEANNH